VVLVLVWAVASSGAGFELSLAVQRCGAAGRQSERCYTSSPSAGLGAD